MNKFLSFFWIFASVINNNFGNTALLDSAKSFFVADKNERQEQINHLEDNLAKSKNSTTDQLKLLNLKREQVDGKINTAKEQQKVASGSQNEFLTKQIAIFNEHRQILLNMLFSKKENDALLEQHIKALKQYQKDPSFKDHVIEARSFYTFDIIQNANNKVAHQEDILAQITAQKNDTLAELENQKKKLSVANQELQERKKAQEEFGSKIQKESADQKLTFTQQGELLDLEQKLANYEKQFAELKLQEINRLLSFINTKLFIETEKLKILKKNAEITKTGLRVLQTEVTNAQDNLEKKKQESLGIKDTYYDEIKILSLQRDKLKKELDQLSRQYQLSIAPQTITWTLENPTLDTFTAIAQIGHKNAQLALLDRRIELLRAQIDLAEAQFVKEETTANIINTWFKITQRKFRNNDEIKRELKHYKSRESEMHHEVAILQDKRNVATNLLGTLNKELSNLRQFHQNLQQEKDGIFKKYPTRFNQLITKITEAEKIITDQIDYTTKLIEIYTNIIIELNSASKELSFILHELETKNIWQRSEYAITWQGIKNIDTDIGIFISDVTNLGSTYFTYWRWQTIKQLIIWLIIAALMFFPCFLLLQRIILPKFYDYFHATAQIYKHKISFSFISALLSFINQKLIPLLVWLFFFFAVYFDIVSDLFPKIIFYLVSIPFLIYLGALLINHIIEYNKKHNYSIFQQSLEFRFFVVASCFVYTTIFVLFFREAFILATLHKSELPTILLASYSIFLRTLVIFSIGKDEIVSLLSNRGPFWSWLGEQINRYYYLILASIVVIMIISDPHVGGYGNLVSYVLWGFIGSCLLFKGILIAHSYAKKWSTHLFFEMDEDNIRERFVHAKTAYGLFVIGLFVLFICLGIYFGTKLWQVSFTVKDIINILNFPIFETGIDKLSQQPIWFTPLKLLVIILFIISGFVIALLFDRLILTLIFEVLPVEPGVQNTISSISRYLILIIAVYLGFQWGGLGTLLLAIGVVIGSIGWIVKEPIADFLSYFIILVQRPVQIGDYIALDEENQGVVRKITARSTILRRKDSYTIILPNSMVLNKPISNWNYARNFVAFDDIEFVVSFTTDPFLVKQIIAQVLDQSNDVLKSPKPIIRLNDFSENGYVFKVRGFVSDINIGRKWDIASDVRFDLVKKLKAQHITIAVPTRVIINAD